MRLGSSGDPVADAIAQAVENNKASANTGPPIYGPPDGAGGGTGRAPANAYEASLTQQGSGTYKIPVWASADPWQFPKGEKAGSAADVRVIEAQQERAKDPRRPLRAPEFFDEDTAKDQFGALLQNPDFVQAWAQLARAAGLIDPDEMNDATKLSEAWDKAVGWSVKFARASKGLTLYTPFEAAQLVAETTGSGLLAQVTDAQRRADDAEKARAYAAAHFTGTKDLATSTDVDKQAGQRNLENLRQLLGRNPTKGEEAAFVGGVNAYAAENPTITKRTGTFKDGEQTAQTNVLSGGMTDEVGQVRRSASSSSPETDANQRATTYYDALTKAARAAI